MYIENEYTVVEKYLNKIPEYIDGDLSVEDILNAYLNGTLTGGVKKAEAKRLNTKQSTGYKDNRFYAPKSYNANDARKLYDLAAQKVTKSNKEEVTSARAKLLFLAHDSNVSELIGITQAEFNKKLRTWSRYSKQAMEVSNLINSGVPIENRWTGIQNCSIINKQTVSDDDILSMVKGIEGKSDEYKRAYIGRTMLALDTHIDWSRLTFDFLPGGFEHSRSTRGMYSNDRIAIANSGYANTVAHEMGHALDEIWGRDIFGEHAKGQTFLSDTRLRPDLITNPEARQFYDNFRSFVDKISDVSDIRSSYTQDVKEVFARFIAQFVEFTDSTAGNTFYRESSMYNDRFTSSQYLEFARLLQEKAMLDSKKAVAKQTANETKLSDRDSEYLELAENIEKGEFKLSDRTSEADITNGDAVMFSDRVTAEDKYEVNGRTVNTLKFFNSLSDSDFEYTYKSMSFWGYDKDGSAILASPMAEDIANPYLIRRDGKPVWYKAVEDTSNDIPERMLIKVKNWKNEKGEIVGETYIKAKDHPELIADDWSNLYYHLVRKNVETGKSETVYARYNPYEHSSNVMFNDQFKGAYKRPNLVTVLMKAPKSEEGAYRAKYSKDPTGWSEWKKGDVSSAVAAQNPDYDRQLYLSRYIAPVAIVSDAEVAQQYKDILKGTTVKIPDRVVTPSLLAELEKIGVPIERTGAIEKYEQSKKKSPYAGRMTYDANGNEIALTDLFDSMKRGEKFSDRDSVDVFRGSKPGRNSASGITWYAETEVYAKNYGDTTAERITLGNVFDAGNTSVPIYNGKTLSAEAQNVLDGAGWSEKYLMRHFKNASYVWQIVNSTDFRDAMLRNGYDTIKAVEAGDETAYGVLNGQKNNTTDGDVKMSDRAEEKRISAGMPDSERANILKSKLITAAVYSGQIDDQIRANISELESRKKSLVAKALKNIQKSVVIPVEIKNEDFDIVVTTNANLFNESVSKEITDAKQLAKLMPVLEKSAAGAVAIESHANRYFFDSNTVLFHNLIGGYIDGDNFVPIRFGVKQNVSGKNYIYVVIDSGAIKTADVTADTPSRNGNAAPTESANINISKLLSKVNSPDILKYVPNEFLDENRKSIKYEAIAETVRRTNDKNDKKYIGFIRSGNIVAATDMVKAAAKAAGYTKEVWHGSDALGTFTVFDTTRGGRDNTQYGSGTYFADNEDLAWGYGEVGKFYLNTDRYYNNVEAGANKGELFDNLSRQLKYAYGFTAEEIARLSDTDRSFELMKQILENKLGLDGYYSGGLISDPFKNTDLPNKILRLAGYEGIEANYNYDRQYVAFYPNQAKSADPITYDDNGNIVAGDVTADGFDSSYLEQTIDSQMAFMNGQLERLNSDLDTLAENIEKGEFKLSDRDGQKNSTTDGGVKYSLRDIKIPTYEELISKPSVKVVDIRSDDSRPYKVRRKSFTNSARYKELINKKIINTDTGERLFITPDTFKHTFSNSSVDNINIVEHLDAVLENAVLTHSEDSRYAPKDRTTGVYKFFGAVETEEGTKPVKLTVKEYYMMSQNVPANVEEAVKSGNISETYSDVYDSKVLIVEDIEKEASSSALATTNELMGDIRPSASEISIKELIELVNKEDREKYIPLPQFEEAVKLSEREETSFDNRTILSNALEAAAQNELERKYIADYKANIAKLNAEEQKLTDLRAQIKELSFAKGKRDTARLNELRDEATKTANRINLYDKKLLKLEAAKPLKDVLERERRAAMKKAADKGRQRLEEYRQSKSDTLMRRKVQRVVNELNNYLLKGSKDKKVMLGLQKVVAEALDVINMETANPDAVRKSLETRMANVQAQIAAETDPEKIKKLMKLYDSLSTAEQRSAERLARLKQAYESIKNSDDPDVANGYDEVISAKIDEVTQLVGDTALRNMNSAQLQAVYDLYKMILTRVRDANKAFKAAKSKTISEIATKTQAQLEAQKQHSKLTSDARLRAEEYSWNNMKPLQAFKRIGSSEFEQVFRNVLAGEGVWARDIYEAKLFYAKTAEKYHLDKWLNNKTRKQRFEFESTSGKRFSVSLEQMMSLYAYSKREAARDHIRKGGIVIDIKTKVRKGIRTYNVTDSEAYNISDETLNDIIGALKENFPEAIEWVDEMQNYLSTVMGAKGNEVSAAMYGIHLFGEKNYFPLKSSDMFLPQAKEQAQADTKIKNSGFTNSLIPHASNPVVLSDFTDVWDSHVDEMSRYHAFVLPLEDFYRVYNFKTAATETDTPTSIDQAIRSAHGEAAVKYIEQLLRDLNGGTRADTTTGFLNKSISLFKKGAVMGSASVVIQQPSAFARAFAYIEPRYFVGGRVENTDKSWEELKKYAPVAVIKEMGGYDTHTGQSTKDYLSGSSGKILDKVDNFLGWFPAEADKLTWCYMWQAAKRKAKSEKLQGEELLKRAGDIFTEAISNTQVYDSVLSRSAVMRSKDGLAKMLSAFMAEPITSLNMIADAKLDWQNKRRGAAIGKVASVATSVVINALLVSLVYAARDDDDDETYVEKYIASAVDKVIEGFNPITYLPYVKDIYSTIRGYTVERSDISIFTDMSKAITKVIKAIEDDDPEAIRRTSIDAANSVFAIFGIPAKNIVRDGRAIANLFTIANSDEFSTDKGKYYALKEGLSNGSIIATWTIGDKPTNKGQLYNSIVEGDSVHERRVRARYESEDKANSAFKEAVMDSFKNGRISETQAINLLVNHADMESEDAKEKVAKAKFKEDYGFSYEDKAEAYAGGEVTRQALIQGIMSTGKTREEAESMVEIYDWQNRGIDIDSNQKNVIENYHEMAEPYGISAQDYFDAYTVKQTQGEEGVMYSAVKPTMAFINGLNITSAQKDALAHCFGWSEKTIAKYKLW